MPLRPFGPAPKPAPTPRKARTRMKPRSEKMQARYEGGVCTTCKGSGLAFALVPFARGGTCPACGGAGTVEGRAALVARLLAASPLCELGDRLQAYTLSDPRHAAFRCQRFATTVHEPHTRARGGDILDENNCRTACHACHAFVHEHPAIALGLGFITSMPPTGETP